MIYNNSQNQTFSTSKISPASNNQSPDPQHQEKQANSQTLASQNYPDQQANSQASAFPRHLEQQANNQFPVPHPNNLTAAEYHELAVGSAIHPELIARNFIHIDGDTVFNYLFISNTIPRLNTGRVTSSFLKQYLHATVGGMWISGLDPHNNWQPMEWGRFKPSQPRIDKNGKLVKYESPPKTPNRVTYFDVPHCLWEIVAKRYNIPLEHSAQTQSSLNLPQPLWSCRQPWWFWVLALRILKQNTKQTNVETQQTLKHQVRKRLVKKLLSELGGEENYCPLSKFNGLSFWEWVLKHPEIPIILCEGEKKAACLLSLGFVAIAIPGIWGGRIGKKDFDERLHPDIMPFTQPGRKFIILFDHETKSKTRWSVFQATLRTGKTIEAAGCTCEVALLPGPEKGVDDFVVERSKLIGCEQAANNSKLIEPSQTSTITPGVNQNSLLQNHKQTENGQLLNHHQTIKPNLPVPNHQQTENSQAVERHQVLNQVLPFENSQVNALLTTIIDDAISLKQYQRSFHTRHRGLSSKYKPDIRVNVKYLSSAVTLPSSGLVALSSDMGTGKTEIIRLVREAYPQIKFLNIGHRVNLLKNLATRLKTEMYSDLTYAGLAKAQALSITIDSLHKLHTQMLNYGCIFIDEACQFLTHLLHSKTCKEYRAEILEVLQYIVYNAPLVIIADAHLDDITVDFFRALRPPGEKPLILKNDWRNGDRLIYWYEGKNSSAIVAQISAALMNKQKIIVASDSKRFIKKLEQSLTIKVRVEETPVEVGENTQQPQTTNETLKLWSIHSDNSGSEENVAFIKDITNAVKDVDALLYSPSLGTGVDINEYHFDLVFGIFHAKSQTATECAQQLYRYRPNVPMHVWVAPRPPFGYQETNAQRIKERMLQTNEVTAFVLRIDRDTGRRGVEKDWALDAYCQILAARNRSLNNLRDDLHDLLTEMGNKIISMGGDEDTFAQEQMKKAAAALDTAYYSAVTKAKDISATEYRQRQNKDYLKPEEVFECEKFRIQDAYGMEVTESLVEKDAGGQLSRSISALEAILKEPEGTIFDPRTNRQYPLPPTIVTDKDRQERENLPLCMDWGNYSAKWLARFNLGLHDILKRLVAGEEVTAHDPELLKMVAFAKQYGVHIKAILGFNVPDKCQPIWLLGMLLDQLGLKLVDRKEGPRGKQVRIFSLSQVELDFALKVIAYRELKRNQKQERARQAQEEQRRYQARMQTLYGIASPPDPVSTPPPNGIGKPLGEGVNTTADQVDFAACSEDGNDLSLANGADGVDFAALQRNGEEISLVHSVEQVNFEGLQTDDALTSTRSNGVDFRQFQPDDGDETPLVNCVEVLRASFNKGVEAIKSVLRSWSEDRRWGTVLLLEEIAANELRSLEQLFPQFYDWLSESVLPMNC